MHILISDCEEILLNMWLFYDTIGKSGCTNYHLSLMSWKKYSFWILPSIVINQLVDRDWVSGCEVTWFNWSYIIDRDSYTELRYLFRLFSSFEVIQKSIKNNISKEQRRKANEQIQSDRNILIYPYDNCSGLGRISKKEPDKNNWQTLN